MATGQHTIDGKHGMSFTFQFPTGDLMEVRVKGQLIYSRTRDGTDPLALDMIELRVAINQAGGNSAKFWDQVFQARDSASRSGDLPGYPED